VSAAQKAPYSDGGARSASSTSSPAARRSCFLTSSNNRAFKAGVVALAIRDRIRIASRSW
jgi:hypothetical protein